MAKWTVQHIGHPTSNAIREDEWYEYSTHTSRDAAHKAIEKARAHLEYGQWDDHYRVVSPNGSIDDHYWWRQEQSDKAIRRHFRNR